MHGGGNRHAACARLIQLPSIMGCGASKAAAAASPGGGVEGEDLVQSLRTVSISQLRDVAPQEVAGTGAHPPRREDALRRTVFFQSGAGPPPPPIPGVVPETGSDADQSSSRKGESIIKMHPPRKPQRLGTGLEAAIKKEEVITELPPEETEENQEQ